MDTWRFQQHFKVNPGGRRGASGSLRGDPINLSRILRASRGPFRVSQGGGSREISDGLRDVSGGLRRDSGGLGGA